MRLSYYIELLGIPAILGPFVLLLAFPFALLAVAFLAVVAVAGVAVMVAGAFAAPVLMVRAARRRWLDARSHSHSDEREDAVDEIAYPAHMTFTRAA
jgi:hypothetical protein